MLLCLIFLGFQCENVSVSNFGVDDPLPDDHRDRDWCFIPDQG